MTRVNEDFTTEEISKVYFIVNKYSQIASTDSAMNEYIDIILHESSKLSKEDIANLAPDDLNAVLRSMGQKHQ